MRIRRITTLLNCAVDTTARANALLAKLADIRCVRRWKCAHYDIDVRQTREHIDTYDFAKPAFHSVAIDPGVRVFRHDNSGPGVTQKGSDVPNLDMRGSDSLPLQADRLERALPRQPMAARKAAMVRCPRTSTAA